MVGRGGIPTILYTHIYSVYTFTAFSGYIICLELLAKHNIWGAKKKKQTEEKSKVVTDVV